MVASIIITTYNRPELLRGRSLKSALAQDFEDYEIIVVDDCSDDYYVIEDSLLVSHFIRHKENKGLSAARNTGIKAAKGKYIVCLDDDNELLPNFLKETVKNIADYDAITGQRVIQYKDLAETATPKLSKFTSIDQAWLIRREVFDEILYDEELRACEDTDFGIRFFKKFKAKVINKPLCVVYDTENSLSFPDERELDGMRKFFVKNFRYYVNEKDELRYLLRLMGRKFYRGGYKLKGLGYFWWSFKTNKTLTSLLHFIVILFGWRVYDLFMSLIERKRASKKL